MGVIELISEDEEIRVELKDPASGKPIGVYVWIRRVPTDVHEKISAKHTDTRGRGPNRYEVTNDAKVALDVLFFAIQRWVGVIDPDTKKLAEVNKVNIRKLPVGFRADLMEACIGAAQEPEPESEDIENLSDSCASGLSGQE